MKGGPGRRRAALGAAGVAVLGVGIAVAVGHSHQDNEAVSGGGVAATVSPDDVATASAAASSAAVPTPSSAASPETDAQRVANARAGKKNSRPVLHPLPEPPPTTPPAEPHVENSGSVRTGQTLQVVSARSDLTGQSALGWLADQGEKVGPAACSQRFRFANQTAASVKPNLLVCWRLSATKSVYTVMVNLHGHPSRAESVAAIAKEWERLG